eukprot:TRINITY_DN21216_c0_g1_i1.p1 TRINITY_DN21216_c0_g1~~TRINITY_DN21216_c0_g1_i1.p1  ORF type:complete len:769 (+),score=148.11 TRINITY_DN21216_c0_g1_i1:172-2307(+)
MTDAAEKVVLVRLRGLVHMTTQASARDLNWCVQMLDRVPHNAAVAGEACRVLEKHIRNNPELCDGVLQHSDAPRACCRVLRLHPEEPAVQSHASAVIGALAERDPERVAGECVLQHGLLLLFLQAIGRFTDNAAVILQLLTVLQRILSVGVEFRHALAGVSPAALSGISTLVGRFKGNATVGPIAEDVCLLISEVPALGAELARAGGINQLLLMARSQPKIRTSALRRVMASVARQVDADRYFDDGPTGNDDVWEDAEEEELPGVLLQKQPLHATSVLAVLAALPGDPVVVTEALKVLRRLALIGESFNGEEVLQLLFRHQEDPQVTGAAAAVLLSLCRKGSQRAMCCTPEAFTGLLAALRCAGGQIDRPVFPAVSRLCALLCRLFLYRPEVCRVALDQGAADVVLSAAAVFTHQSSCLRFAVCALLCACAEPVCRSRIAAASTQQLEQCPGRCAVDVLMNALPAQYADRPLQALLCGLLKTVCLESKDAAIRANARGGARVARKLMSVAFERRDAVLFAEAAGLGRGLSWTAETARTIADVRGLELLLDACQYFGRHAEGGGDEEGRLVGGERALAEGALCVLRLALVSPDVNDGLNVLLDRIAAGYRAPELVRVTWDPDRAGFRVAAGVGEVRRVGGVVQRGWLNTWVEAGGWFGQPVPSRAPAASAADDRLAAQLRLRAKMARGMRTALVDPEAVVRLGDTPWTLGFR